MLSIEAFASRFLWSLLRIADTVLNFVISLNLNIFSWYLCSEYNFLKTIFAKNGSRFF